MSFYELYFIFNESITILIFILSIILVLMLLDTIKSLYNIDTYLSYQSYLNEPSEKITDITSAEVITNSDAYFDQLSFEREYLLKALNTTIDKNHQIYIRKGDYYFYFASSSSSSPQLLRTKDVLVNGKVVLDSARLPLSRGQSAESIGTWIDPNGKYLAYGTCSRQTLSDATFSGSHDSMIIRVRNIQSGRDLNRDEINDADPDACVAWLTGADNGPGFFYINRALSSGEPSGSRALYRRSLCFHHLYTSITTDITILDLDSLSLSSCHHDCSHEVIVTHDNKYLLLSYAYKASDKHCSVSSRKGINQWHAKGNSVFIFDLSEFEHTHADTVKAPVCVVQGYDYCYDYVSNRDSVFYFRTNQGAPRFRMVQCDIYSTHSNAPSYVSVDPCPIVNNAYETPMKTKPYPPYIPMSEPSSSQTRQTPAHLKSPLLHHYPAIPSTHLAHEGQRMIEWLPEDRVGGVLVAARVTYKNLLVLHYDRHGSHSLQLHVLKKPSSASSVVSSGSSFTSLPHPPHGSIIITCDPGCPDIFYSHSSFTDPGILYHALIRVDPDHPDSVVVSVVPIRLRPVLLPPLSLSPPSSSQAPYALKARKKTLVAVDMTVYDTKQVLIPLASDPSVGSRAVPVYISGHRSDLYSRQEYAVRTDVLGEESKEVDETVESEMRKFCILFVCSDPGIVSLQPSYSQSAFTWMHTYRGLFCAVNITPSLEPGGHNSDLFGHVKTNPVLPHLVEDLRRVVRYLVDNKYASYSTLGLLAGSGGSSLIASFIDAYPDLCGTAVIDSGNFSFALHEGAAVAEIPLTSTVVPSSTEPMGTSHDRHQAPAPPHTAHIGHVPPLSQLGLLNEVALPPLTPIRPSPQPSVSGSVSSEIHNDQTSAASSIAGSTPPRDVFYPTTIPQLRAYSSLIRSPSPGDGGSPSKHSLVDETEAPPHVDHYDDISPLFARDHPEMLLADEGSDAGSSSWRLAPTSTHRPPHVPKNTKLTPPRNTALPQPSINRLDKTPAVLSTSDAAKCHPALLLLLQRDADESTQAFQARQQCALDYIAYINSTAELTDKVSFHLTYLQTITFHLCHLSLPSLLYM